jgi:hypothetical protein
LGYTPARDLNARDDSGQSNSGSSGNDGYAPAVDESGQPIENPNTSALREYERDRRSERSVPAYEGNDVVPLDENGGGNVMDDGSQPRTLDDTGTQFPNEQPARRSNQ